MSSFPCHRAFTLSLARTQRSSNEKGAEEIHAIGMGYATLASSRMRHRLAKQGLVSSWHKVCAINEYCA
jgi:hypothetical protein